MFGSTKPCIRIKGWNTSNVVEKHLSLDGLVQWYPISYNKIFGEDEITESLLSIVN
ncbi:hypothetical protein ACS0TY_011384 [Phlomoides rotata]